MDLPAARKLIGSLNSCLRLRAVALPISRQVPKKTRKGGEVVMSSRQQPTGSFSVTIFQGGCVTVTGGMPEAVVVCRELNGKIQKIIEPFLKEAVRNLRAKIDEVTRLEEGKDLDSTFAAIEGMEALLLIPSPVDDQKALIRASTGTLLIEGPDAAQNAISATRVVNAINRVISEWAEPEIRRVKALLCEATN